MLSEDSQDRPGEHLDDADHRPTRDLCRRTCYAGQVGACLRAEKGWRARGDTIVRPLRHAAPAHTRPAGTFDPREQRRGVGTTAAARWQRPTFDHKVGGRTRPRAHAVLVGTVAFMQHLPRTVAAVSITVSTGRFVVSTHQQGHERLHLRVAELPPSPLEEQR